MQSSKPFTFRCAVSVVSALACLLCDPVRALQQGDGAAQCHDTLPAGANVVDEPQLRVAIVGSGIGGAAAAYQLSLLTNATITVFEAEDRVGGRIQEAQLQDGTTLELGGSIGILANKHLVHFADVLGLQRVAPSPQTESIGIWDGARFVCQLDGSLSSKLRAVRRYKLAAWATARVVRKAVRQFVQIYDAQPVAAGNATRRAFSESRGLWRYLGLEGLTQRPLAPYLHARCALGTLHLISRRYIREVVAALTQVNYNQPPNTLTALAGLIGLAPDDTTFRVAGGMGQVPRGLLRRSGATVQLRTRVQQVVRAPCSDATMAGTDARSQSADSRGTACRPQWLVKAAQADAADEPPDVEPFDAVIVAAPMHLAGIQVSGEPQYRAPPPQPYQTVHASFVRGRLRRGYFNSSAQLNSKSAELPDFIGVTEGSTAAFHSISRIKATSEQGSGQSVHNGRQLFKMFTTADPHKAALAEAFEEGAELVAHTKWQAYPHYSAPERLPPFRLAPQLYYVNAIEAGASCIEISSIGGINAANMLVQDTANEPLGADNFSDDAW